MDPRGRSVADGQACCIHVFQTLVCADPVLSMSCDVQGLGALVVRVDAAEILHKLFWGGGAVSLATSSADFHVLKCRPADKLEDGTVNFLDIISLKVRSACRCLPACLPACLLLRAWRGWGCWHGVSRGGQLAGAWNVKARGLL